MDEQRIIEIETRLAYQEQAINELNQVVTDQQARLTRLEQVAESLKARVQSIGSADGGSDPTDGRPPHY